MTMPDKKGNWKLSWRRCRCRFGRQRGGRETWFSIGTTGWATRAVAAINQGACGLMVVNPVIDAVDELIEVAAAHAAPVVIDRPFSSNPAIDQAASWPGRAADPHELVESAVTTPVATDLVRLALDQLSLIRRVATAVQSADPLFWDGSGYVLQGRLADGRRMIMTAAVTRVVDRSAWLRISVPPGRSN